MNGLRVDVRSKRFGGVKDGGAKENGAEVLGAISFELEAGERAALLGPSGIGKSTLLSIIAGLDTAFEGSVALPSGRVAMVFQSPRLLPWRTLTENLTLTAAGTAAGTGGEGAATVADARAALAEVGLSEAADQHPEKVSLGMQRRAALARALLVKPSLLLMDEPLVSLDTKSAAAMRALVLKTLDLTGAAALIATHDKREALMLTDRVLELDGPPATLVRDRISPLAREQRADAADIERVHADWFPD